MAKRQGNNQGTTYRRKDGTFRSQVSIEGHRISHSAKTFKECEQWRKQKIGQIDEGLTYSGSKLFLSEFLSDWLMNKEGTMRPGPWKQYELVVRKYINPQLGRIKLQDLRNNHIQKLYNDLRKKGVGIPTIQKIHTVLRSALNHAVKINIITRNPTQAVLVPKKPKKEMKTWDENQVNQFMISISGHKLEVLFHLSFVTGMRQMELLGLKWSDINWSNQTIRVERQLERHNLSDRMFAPTKTDAGRRTIKLGISTMEKLKSHYQKQNDLRKQAGKKWNNFDLIFTTNNGTPINHSNLRRDFNKLLEDAGLPRIRFHDIRHTAASLMLNNEIHYKAVSERLGHARPSITLDIYSHVDSAMQEKAATVLDEIVTPISVPELHQNCTETAPENIETHLER